MNDSCMAKMAQLADVNLARQVHCSFDPDRDLSFGQHESACEVQNNEPKNPKQKEHTAESALLMNMQVTEVGGGVGGRTK